MLFPFVIDGFFNNFLDSNISKFKSKLVCGSKHISLEQIKKMTDTEDSAGQWKEQQITSEKSLLGHRTPRTTIGKACRNPRRMFERR